MSADEQFWSVTMSSTAVVIARSSPLPAVWLPWTKPKPQEWNIGICRCVSSMFVVSDGIFLRFILRNIFNNRPLKQLASAIGGGLVDLNVRSFRLDVFPQDPGRHSCCSTKCCSHFLGPHGQTPNHRRRNQARESSSSTSG